MLDEALEISRSGGNVLLETWGLAERAEVALAMQRLDLVEACVRRSLALLEPDKQWYGLPGRLEIVRGRFAAAGHRWEEADGHFERALVVTRAFELLYDEARAHHAVATTALQRGAPGAHDQATVALGRAGALFRQVGADRDLDTVISTLARL
jgi:hypothetical protein